MNRKYGWKRDYHDDRDYAATVNYSLSKFVETDLRPDCPGILDQGQIASCVLNAIALAMHYKIRILPSRLFAYYNVRDIEGTIAEDDGCQIRDAIKAVASLGVCPENAWPYEKPFTEKPDANAYAEAQFFKISNYVRVPVSREGILTQLTANAPVIVGIQVFQSFESAEVAKSGVVPMPGAKEQNLGGHGVLVVGSTVFNSLPYYWVANSWGVDWGQKGFFLLPEAYLMTYGNDFWSIDSVELPVDSVELPLAA